MSFSVEKLLNYKHEKQRPRAKILMPELRPENKLRVGCSPEPEELREDGSDEAVNEDVRPHQLAGKLEGLEAGVMEQQEARPQQQQVEQTHKP